MKTEPAKHTHTIRARARKCKINGWCVGLKNEMHHTTEFSEVVIFKCSCVLRNAQKFMFLIAEPLSRNNDNLLSNWRNSFFLKPRFMIQPCFLRLWFSSYLMFSELHEFNRSLSFKTRSVARKQCQVLEKLKKLKYLIIFQK